MVTIEVEVGIITAQVSALTFNLRICFQPLFQLLALNFTSIIVSQFSEILIVLV